MTTATTSPMLLLHPNCTHLVKKLPWATFQQRNLHREDALACFDLPADAIFEKTSRPTQ